MKSIALCINVNEAEYNTPGIEKRYPGAGWIQHYLKEAAKKEIDVVHGVEAVRQIEEKKRKASDFLVVQEEMNGFGQHLIKLGAYPRIAFCAESPMYAPQFYDALYSLQCTFDRVLSFGGPKQLYFPSYEESWIRPFTDWKDKKYSVCVMSNKHYKSLLGYSEGPSFKFAISRQLHDTRYSALYWFKEKGKLDLYGHGWRDPSSQPCSDKLETISKYKFCFAIENVEAKGYITEKIIDCFVAGVVPVYLGAPDISNYIPKEYFVSMRDFDSWDSLLARLDSMTEQEAERMISEARRYCIRNFLNQHFAMDLFYA